MKAALPEAYDQLVETMQRLEEHYREMQDIEFTVEDGRLYLLQTRSGKRPRRPRFASPSRWSTRVSSRRTRPLHESIPVSSTSFSIR